MQLTKKCIPSQVFFKDFYPTGREQLFCTTRTTSMTLSGIYLFIDLSTYLFIYLSLYLFIYNFI